MTIKNLWTEYDGKGFSAEHADYAERATADEAGNDIASTYATKTENDGKADKVASATSGNFAGLDANGNLTDSGSKPSDFIQEERIVYIEGTIASGPSGFVVTCSTTYNEITELLRSDKVPVCKFTMPSSQFNQAWYFYYHITTTSKHSFGSTDVAKSNNNDVSYMSCVYVESNNSWHFLEVDNYSREYWNRLLGQKQNTVGTKNVTTAVDADTPIATGYSSDTISFNTAGRVATYVSSKVSSDLGITSSAYGGKAATAGSADYATTAGSAGSATNATNATNVNLTGSVKDTSTTNGDTIQVKAGSGTAAEINIVNAKHAASADSATTASSASSVEWADVQNKVSASTTTVGIVQLQDSVGASESSTTTAVTPHAVRDAIDSAVASAYHHAGTKTVAQLVSTLLVPANEGNVYNITDSGTTTSNFIEGAGHPIRVGDNVGICDIGSGVYKFDLLSGFVDLSNYLQKSSTTGLVKNDGSIDTSSYLTTTGAGQNVTSTFTKNASDTSGMTSGKKLSELFTAISNFFASLKALAFKATVGTGDIDDDAITAAKVKDNETLPVNVSGTASNIAAGGTSGQYLKSNGSGAPTWEDLPQGSISTDTDSAAFNGNTTIATGFSNNKLHLNIASRLWTYIQDRISAVLGLTAAKYDGAAATNRCERGTNDSNTDYNAEIAQNTAYVKEMPPLASHSPNAVWNHLYTSCGASTDYAVQLVIGMTGNGMHIRHKDNGTWTSWMNLRHAGTWFDAGILPIERGGTGANNLANVTVGTATNAQTAESVGKTSGSNSVAVSTSGIGLINGTNSVTMADGRVNATAGFGGNLNGTADSAKRAYGVSERYHSSDATQDITFSKLQFTPPSGSTPASGLVVWGTQKNFVEFSSMSSADSDTYLHAILDSSYQKKSNILLSSSGAINYDGYIAPTSGTQTLSGTGATLASVTQNSKVLLDLTINNNGETDAVLLVEVKAGGISLGSRIFFAKMSQTVAIPFGVIYSNSATATLSVSWSVQSGQFKGSFYTRWLAFRP